MFVLFKMYSQDFRRLAVSLYNQGRSFSCVARLLRISSSTVHRWVHSGAAVRKRKRRPLTDRLLAEVASFVGAHPTTTHNKIRGHLLASLRERVGLRTVARLLTALRLSRKRTVKRMSRTLCPDRQAAAAFENIVNAQTDQLVVCVDECHFSERVLPLYGYSPVGHPCVVNSTTSGWTSRSLILAVASDGSKFYHLHDGAINTDRFQRFVLSLPYPSGTTIVLDNVAFHKRQRPFLVKRYRAMYTPPYSPEHNSPVENAFGKIKSAFRALWPWASGVQSAVHDAVRQLTADDIDASFRRWRMACKSGRIA